MALSHVVDKGMYLIKKFETKLKYNSDNITDRNVGMELCAYTSRLCEYLLVGTPL